MKLNLPIIAKVQSLRPAGGRTFERRYELIRMVMMGVLIVGGVVLVGRNMTRMLPVDVLGKTQTSVPGESAPALAGASVILSHSPENNLERSEMVILLRAKERVDVAMYSFTDLELARELVSLHKRGVAVRVYRDNSEYVDEESRAGGGRETTTSVLLAGGVPVRVKAGGDLMHLKSFSVDKSLLRSGSANWSQSGLKRQDNDVVYIPSAAAVTEFEGKFNQMWSRVDNTVLK